MKAPDLRYEIGKLTDTILGSDRPIQLVAGHLEIIRGRIQQFENELREEFQDQFELEDGYEFRCLRRAIQNLEVYFGAADESLDTTDAMLYLDFIRLSVSELGKRYG